MLCAARSPPPELPLLAGKGATHSQTLLELLPLPPAVGENLHPLPNGRLRGEEAESAGAEARPHVEGRLL